jgi:cysteinyl-tRNA synthetase
MLARYNAAAFGRLVQTLKTHQATLSVIESSTGGLISAGIMGQPGASAVYWGGSIAYNTKKSQPFLLNDAALHQRLSQKPPSGNNSKEAYIHSKVDWTCQAALAFLDEVGTDFCLAQNGATGPTFRPPDLHHGFSVVAVAARHTNTSRVVCHQIFTSDHAQRQANMEYFAQQAAVLAEEAVRQVKEGTTTMADPVFQEFTNPPVSTDHFDRATHLRSQPDELHQLSLQAQYMVLHKNFTLFQSPASFSSSSSPAAPRRIVTLSLDQLNKVIDMTGFQTTTSFLGLLNDSQPLFSVDFVKGKGQAAMDTETLSFHLAQVSEGSVWEDTRTVAPLLSTLDNELALHATALAQWQRRAPYCTVCGDKTTLLDGGTCRKCTSCGSVSWPRQDPSMITVVSSRDNQRVLLARSPRHPEGLHTALAGFVEAGETMERAVAREVFEETGVRIDADSIQYVASQPWPFPQSTMVGFLAVADDSQGLNLDSNEIVSARWFDRNEVVAATQVEGPVMQPEVAKAAFAADPTLKLLVPPRGVLARTLLETWLHRSVPSMYYSTSTTKLIQNLDNYSYSVHCKRRFSTEASCEHAECKEESKEVSLEGELSRMRLYNSLSDKIEEIGKDRSFPYDGSKQKGFACYTCGPTVYAPTHLGHARTYVCLDILRRVWEDEHERKSNGPPPLFVMNITDVDDKILQQANANQEDPIVLARRFEAAFWRDMAALNCLRPHVVTRVTEHVESHIMPFVKKLLDSGIAYILDGDGVYFDVRAFETKKSTLTRYGKLAPPAQSESLFDTGDQSTEKRDARDFVLWKAHKPGEALAWEAPWGKGRPGWHIECSAMIEAVQDRFRDTHRFLVHTGGVDLKFPHHTNEIAQSEAYQDEWCGEWIPHWIHFGHLHIEGRKMSKSLKNFVTVEELFHQQNANESGGLACPADDFRLWCLSCASYRNPTYYSPERLKQARLQRGRIVRFLVAAERWMHDVEDSQTIQKGTRQWTDSDMQLYHASTELMSLSRSHLLDDLDGAAWTRNIISFVDNGIDYLRDKDASTHSIEALQIAVQNLRRVLALVGFSVTTVEAGRDTKAHQSSQIVGGESRLIDAFVGFREEIRQVGLTVAKSMTEKTAASEDILRACDNLRDHTLPSLGVELMDKKVVDQHMYRETAEGRNNPTWRYCIPRQEIQIPLTDSDRTTTVSQSKTMPRLEDLLDIPLIDFFRSSLFAGQFAAFDENGVPTHNADGSEVSKRQLKKLLKKRALHEQRVESRQKQ